MVEPSKKNEVALWLLARQGQWNKPDRRGSKPFNCNLCARDRGYREMHGCTSERKQGPRTIGPWQLKRCPNWFLKKDDSLRDEVVRVFQDYRSGTVKGWPDTFAGAVADGVRLIERELNACESELLRAQQQELETQRSKGGFNG